MKAIFGEFPGGLVIMLPSGKVVTYALLDVEVAANEQQYNLPDGCGITYPDGSKLIHFGPYALFRNWPLEDGKVVDRVAVKYANLKLYTEG